MVKNIDQYVDDDRRYEPGRNKSRIVRFVAQSVPCCGRYLGNYIVLLYFVIKFVYMFNTVAQIFLINALLGHNFWTFGYQFLTNVWRGDSLVVANSKYFPSNS